MYLKNQFVQLEGQCRNVAHSSVLMAVQVFMGPQSICNTQTCWMSKSMLSIVCTNFPMWEVTALHQKQYSLWQAIFVQRIRTRGEEQWSCQGNSVWPRSPTPPIHTLPHHWPSLCLWAGYLVPWPPGYGLSSFHWLAQMEEGWASQGLLLPGSRMESWRVWCRASTWLGRDPLSMSINDKSNLFNLFLLFTFLGVTTWSGLL